MDENKAYTRYEKARIVSARAMQIAYGSPILVSVPKNVKEPMDIALLEWEKGVIPIEIRKRTKIIN
jgi:DNA-directed RNA polymerase subunit K